MNRLVERMRLPRCCAWLPVVALLSACAATPEPIPDPEPVMEETPRVEIKVDETAMLPLLGYLELLPRMSTKELARQRQTLAALPQTPSVQLRMAMLLGQARTPPNLAKAQSLLASILKSNEATASSLRPLARLMTTHYSERQKLEQQNARLTVQMSELEEQLSDGQRRNDELQRKIDALADIERSLPKPPAANDAPAGAAR